MAGPLEPSAQVFRLKPGRGEIALHVTGFRYPGGWRGRDQFSAYGDLTHLPLGLRMLRIGTRRGTALVPRSWFLSPDDPALLVRALLERVAREPGGAEQLERMAEVEALARSPRPLRATGVVLGLVLGVFALQLWSGPTIQHVGSFSATLTRQGETWRLITANLLHAGPVHLLFNSLGLLVLGALIERPLGSVRTALVVGLSALGATAAGLVVSYEALVGASGIVAGMAGAAVWMELRHPDRLPAGWRIPRRLFFGALLADALLPLLLPFIAGAAHLGGFLGGLLAGALAAGRGLHREPLRPALATATLLLGAVGLLALLGAARFLVGAGDAWERHASRLLALEQPPALLMNDAAWLIAIAREPSPGALEAALELAERAVQATRRRDPNVLDTLAEAQFQLGDRDAAVETIDEAIALAPREPYFQEQRRRFTGERAAEDRPVPPQGPILPAPRRHPPLPAFESPGVPI